MALQSQRRVGNGHTSERPLERNREQRRGMLRRETEQTRQPYILAVLSEARDKRTLQGGMTSLLTSLLHPHCILFSSS